VGDTASISGGAKREISVSKSTMRFGRAEAGEIGVAMARTLRAVITNRPGSGIHIWRAVLDAAAQACILERRKFIEPAYENSR